MICVFITAFRIKSDDWSGWRSHMRALFDRRAAHADWDLSIGQHEETLIDPGLRATDPVGAYLGALRGHDIYRHVIDGRYLNDIALESQLVILRSGEIALIEVANIADGTDIDWTDLRSQYCAELAAHYPALSAALSVFRPRGAALEGFVDLTKNATQALIAYDRSNARQTASLEAAFAREGLDFVERRQAAGQSMFVAGWSFSGLASTDPREVGLFAALMMRLQVFWYHQRVMRDGCIEDAKTFTSDAAIATKVQTGHALVQRQFEYTVWTHELREFAANLKPFLKSGYDAVADHWELSAEALYIEKSMQRAHDLITSGYQSRILLQERRQSSLLFIIAAVGLLGTIGSIVSMMTLLTWGGLLDIASLQTPLGQTSIYIGLAITLGLFVVIIAIFVRDRLRNR